MSKTHSQDGESGDALLARARESWNIFLEDQNHEHRELLFPCVASAPVVWASSQFIPRVCFANPEILIDLVGSGDLFRVYRDGEIRQRASRMGRPFNEVELMHNLRRLRLREVLRIAWRDLAGWTELEEVMAIMSTLADVCVDYALRILFEWTCQQRGTPIGEHSDSAVTMTVLALGKLGGRELNFSSDIDLIFAYSEAGHTDHVNPISNHEFFHKLGQKLIKILEEPTADGIVFRVDMRLRPNGSAGPLALSFDALEQYYQTHGRDWERYALIKSRVISGDPDAGKELLAILSPFVYRRYLDFGAFDSVRSMKRLINRELQRKGVLDNIKLGAGGIREIEFIAQSFQLIRGGRDPVLQNNQLLPTLACLAKHHLLTSETATKLAAAYRFFRIVENRLQMVADQQTHRLPEAPRERARLALAMGAPDWDAVHRKIKTATALVHTHFGEVFSTAKDAETKDNPNDIEDLWSGILDDETSLKVLRAHGFENAETARDDIQNLRHGRLYQAYSKDGRERFDRLMPILIEAAGETRDSNLTLKRLIQFIEGVGRRSAYLVLLIENPLALSQLVKLSSASAWINSWIRQHPILLDELLDPITAQAASTAEYVIDEFQERLRHIDTDDLELQMEALREVHHGQILRVAAANVSGLIQWSEVGERLSTIAEVTLENVIALSQATLENKLGKPSAAQQDAVPAFAFIAYGKLGSLELGYNSDLDLVFVHDGAKAQGATNGARSVTNEHYYSRLVQRIVHAITTRTAAGVLYEIDMRLRPSGRAGSVVSSFDGFRRYQIEQAWTWEHQALVRARLAVGPASLRDQFEAVRAEVLCRRRDPVRLRADILEMRDKMRAAHDTSGQEKYDLKHGFGGIVDIEFLVQYYVLRWAEEFPGIIEPRKNMAIIESLQRAGLLQAETAVMLGMAYDTYLSAEHHAKLEEQPPLVSDADFRDERSQVGGFWQRVFSGQDDAL